MKRILTLWLALAVFLLIPVSAFCQQEEDLLLNGGFELLDSSGVYPLGWETNAYRTQTSFTRFSISEEKAHSGQYSAKIENINMNDARYLTTVAVEPESMYRISGYILVDWMEDGGNGANFALEDVYGTSECLFDTDGQWQYVEWYGETDTDQTELTFGVRIGGFSSESTGCAYFDDMKMVKVNVLPDGQFASLWYSREDADQGGVKTEKSAKTEQKSTALFIALALAFVALGAAFCLELRAYQRPDSLEEKPARSVKLLIVCLCLLAALAARILLAIKVEGYQVDINCFTLWSQRMAKLGPAGFYAEDYFCDYPPGYLYVLYCNGMLMKLLPQASSLLIIKLVPILCDMAIALLLYRLADKRIGALPAVLVSLLYALNPASLITGASWGQVDAALALLMLLTAVFAMKKRWIVAIPLFFVAALCKPQALLLAPVGGMWLIFSIVKTQKGERKKPILEALYGFLIALAATVVIVLPFSLGKPNLNWLIDLYKETLASYDYATVNTANLYYLLGGNWSPLTEAVSENAVPMTFSFWLPLITGLILLLTSLAGGNALWRSRKKASLTPSFADPDDRRKLLLSAVAALFGLAFIVLSFALKPITFLTYGYILFAMVFAWALCYFLSDARPETLPFAMALTLIGVYVLTLKMHERYLYSGLVLLLLGYIATGDRRQLYLLIGFSVTTFLNTAIVLDNSILFGSSYGHLRLDTQWLNLTLCVINLMLLAYAAYISYTGLRKSHVVKVDRTVDPEKKDRCYVDMILSPKDARLRLTLKDYIIMGVTMALYGVLCFSQLGSTVAPQNAWIASSAHEQIVFEVDTDEPYELLYYGGVNYDDFTVATSEDGLTWSEEYPCEMREGVCYRWLYVVRAGVNGSSVTYPTREPESTQQLQGRYLRLTTGATGLKLYELVARDLQHNILPIAAVSQTGTMDNYITPISPETLIDEQDTLTGEPGWFNGTYFDEIYHVRTAIEHIEGDSPYEFTHPPLGKLMIALGILIFGQTPFGWRFMGALTGLIMLPAMYLLARQLTKRRDLSIFSMLVMTFDLMHFAQTRLATIDSYPVLFIMLSVLCMLRFMQSDFFKTGRTFYKTWIPLGLSGLFMGLGIASKWIGIYSAVGLAVLFFSQMFRVARAGYVASGMEVDAYEGEAKQRLIVAREKTMKRILLTCLACVGFFILIPALIYYLSYIPHLSATGKVSLERLIDVQKSMFAYHSQPGLGMDHPFQSPWYEWPLILKPMWFAKDYYEPAGLGSTIMCMGNPFIFYTGALAMVGVLAAFVIKHLSVGRGGVRLRQGNGNLSLYVLTIGFLAQYLPWVLVPRSMYMYHYFASVPFIMLAVTYWLGLIPTGKKKLLYGLMIGYIVIAAAFFIMFYPYVSGLEVSTQWLDAMKWFPGLYY